MNNLFMHALNVSQRPNVCFCLSIAAALMTLGLGMAPARAQGMPNDNKAAWTAPARAARKENPIPANDGSIGQGKALFTMACYPCHGPAGKGDGPTTGGLERNGAKIRPGNLSEPKMWLQSDGAIFWKITEGNAPMPAFGQTLTEEQRWQVVNYVRTLAPRAVASNNQIAQH